MVALAEPGFLIKEERKFKMTQRAYFREMSCPLSDDFAIQLIEKKFGKEAIKSIEEKMPRYVRGEKKGKMKGLLMWDKLTEGGWARDVNGNGGVCRLSISFRYRIVLREWRKEEQVVKYLSRVSNCVVSDYWDEYRHMKKKLGDKITIFTLRTFCL